MRGGCPEVRKGKSMNEKLLYVRIKGRAQGPFTIERLKELARRGQVSRAHQVSEDGASWTGASQYPDIFATAAGHPVQPAPSGHPRPTSEPAMAMKSEPAERWYYAVDAEQRGPIERTKLQVMLDTGQLPADTEVWREGMADWAPAAAVPGLMAPRAQPRASAAGKELGPSSAGKDSGGEVGSLVCRSLSGSRTAVAFVASVGFLYAGIYAFCAMLLLMGGLAQGVIPLIVAAVFVIGSLLLLKYRSHINNVVFHKSESRLVAALESLHTFWVYFGVVSVLPLVFAAVIMLIAFFAARALPFHPSDWWP